jgi:hypothetical protein
VSTTVQAELSRAADYVEATIDTLGEKVREIITSGLSYDVKVFKDGGEVQSVPVSIAGVLAAVSLLPPARVLAMASLAGANLAGYTFRLHKLPSKTSK